MRAAGRTGSTACQYHRRTQRAGSRSERGTLVRRTSANEGGLVSTWSTPRSPDNHDRRLSRTLNRRIHTPERDYDTCPMTTHTFTLIVDGADLQADALVDEVFKAGCHDALVSRADGIQFVDFDREADTLQAAVQTAVAELESIAGIAVTYVADAGLVSMADIANRSGR